MYGHGTPQLIIGTCKHTNSNNNTWSVLGLSVEYSPTHSTGVSVVYFL